MATYKRLVLYSILADLYPPKTPIACGMTYASITIHTDQPLVSEQTIIDLYPSYVQKYNVGVLRQERAIRLMSTDMYGLADYPFKSDESKEAWFTYRQALRDITNVYLNPEVDENDILIGITWPEKPTS